MNPKLSKYRQVGHLHATCINRGFLATLGEPFLALLYQAIDNDKRSVLLVEERDGEVLGFVSGGQGMGSIYKQLLRKPWALMLALMPVLLSPKKVVAYRRDLATRQLWKFRCRHSAGRAAQYCGSTTRTQPRACAAALYAAK